MAWAIWDVYRRCANPGLLLDVICNRIREELRLKPVVITTNYDVLAEMSLSQTTSMWKYYYPGFEREGRTNFLLPAKEPSFVTQQNVLPIIKLHGSANWFDVGDTWIATKELSGPAAPSVALTNSEYSIAGLQSGLEAELANRGLKMDATKIVPALVPPMLGKSAMSAIIVQQWREAIRAIERARQLWIIGYSFPATDMFMTRILAEGIQRNADLEHIVICDAQAETLWKDRLENIFAPMVRTRRLRFCSLLASDLLRVMKDYEASTWVSRARNLPIVQVTRAL